MDVGGKVTKLVFKTAGFRKILRSGAALADVSRRARAMASAAGEGVGVQTSTGANRVRATVATETWEAAEREATNKTLTRAIGAGRG
jgi:hypothetical protein